MNQPSIPKAAQVGPDPLRLLAALTRALSSPPDQAEAQVRALLMAALDHAGLQRAFLLRPAADGTLYPQHETCAPEVQPLGATLARGLTPAHLSPW